MTFKHITFSDSPIMRSLERVAREKGLVKPESLKKEASSFVKKSYKTSNNLMQDLMTLCAGLRDKGYDDYAEELESHVLAYKFAAQDAGEKMIQNSHPEGSPKLDVLGDSVVENIIDQHLAMLKVVNKQPAGKLSTASDILKAVKIALAEEPEIPFDKNEVYKALESALDSVREINKIVYNFNQGEDANVINKVPSININIFEKAINSLSLQDVNACRQQLNIFDTVAKPRTILIAGLSRRAWTVVLPHFKNAINNVAFAQAKINHPVDAFETLYNDLTAKLNKAMSSVNSLKSLLGKYEEATTWLNNEIKDITTIWGQLGEANTSKKIDSLKVVEKSLNEEIGNINSFKSVWLSSSPPKTKGDKA